MAEGYSAPTISTTAALTTASLELLAANPNRSFCSVTNTSPVDVSLAFGTPAIAGSGIVLGPGESLQVTVDRQALTWEGWKTLAINGIAASGAARTMAMFDANFTG